VGLRRSLQTQVHLAFSLAVSFAEALLQLLHCLVDRERSRPLARREFPV